MSKIKQYVRHLAVVAMATLLAHGAWAEVVVGTQLVESNLDTQFTNIDGAQSVLINKLLIPGTDDLPAGSKVTIQSIGIAYRNNHHPYLVLSQGGNASRASSEGVESTKTVTKSDGTTADIKWIEYSFSDVEVTIGTEEPCYQRAGQSGSSTSEAKDLALFKPKSGVGVLQSSFADYSLAYEINYTVTKIVGSIVFDKTAVAVSEINAQVPAGETVIAVTVPDGTTITVDAEPAASLNVKSEGAVTVIGSADHAITSTDVTKISLGSVAGAKKFVLPSIIDGMTAPAAGITYLYQGGDALTTLPYARNADNENAINIDGTVEIAKTVTVDGQLVPFGNKNYVISDGALITVGKATLANKGGVTQTFVQNGGTVTVTSSDPATSTGAAMLLGHWSSTANYTVNGGKLSVANAPIRLGWDGTGNMTIAGGTVTTTGFRGGSQNGHGGAANLVLNSGVIEMGADGIDLGNTGAVTLNGGTLKATDNSTITVGKSEGFKITGSTTINVADGKTLTLASALVSSNGGAIVKTGTGTIAVGTNRPTMNVVEGSVKITATASEIAAGKLVLTVTPDAAAASDDKVSIVDGDGNTVEISNVSIDGTTVTITLETIPPVKTSTSISELALPPETTGTLVIEGGATEESAITITFDANLPEAVDIAIMGFVKFVANEGIEIPYAKMSFEDGCTLIFDAIDGYDIPSGATVIAGTASGTITNAGTLTIKGDSTFKLANTGTITIAGGTSTVSADDQAIKGTVNIAAGAEFVNKSGDAVSYGSPSTTFNVYGTLTMADNTRWTVGGESKINLYGGCTVTGAKTGNGAFDLYRNGEIITVNRGADESISAVTIDARIRARNGSADNASEIKIASGMTLAVTGGFVYADRVGRVKRTGDGHFTGTIPLSNVTLIYTTDSVGNIPAHFVVSGTSTIEWHGNGSTPVCSNDSKTDPFITVNPNATLKIYGHDYSGWNGALRDTGWIVNNGTLVFEGYNGSRFWREHIVMGDGSTVTIDNGGRALLMYGGAGTEDNCQFILPEGSATIKAGEGDQSGDNAVLYFGNDGGGTWGDDTTINKPTGISVGEDATLTITCPIKGNQAIAKHGAGTLVIGNETSSYTGAVTLNAGSIVSAITLNVTCDDANMKLETSDVDADGYITYSLVQRDATDIYLTYADRAYGYVLGGGAETTPIENDVIVVDSAKYTDNWHVGQYTELPDMTGHTLKLVSEMNFKGGGFAANQTVVVDASVYLYGNIGAGAAISGTGTLYLGHEADTEIGDGVEISCGVGFQGTNKATINGAVTISGTITMGNGLFKLASGATLTCAEQDDGKVISGVEDKVAKYDGTKYTLVDATAALPGEEYFSGEGADAYKEWAEKTGVKADTDPENAEDLAIAYSLGVTGTTTVAEALAAAKDKVKDLIAQIDCSKLADEDGLTAALATLNETLATKGLRATLTPVPSTEIETTAKLYRLVINAIPANTAE